MLIGKNKRKMGGKALCLIFAFLLSINSFAAIVSDNDGSAFVTKAEFEALKKGFADQIDNYNTSIDSKIDGAIAAYLAGTQLSHETIIDLLVESYKDLYWCHDFSLEANKKTFTNKTTSAITSGTFTPDYTNMTGWVPWRTNRGARATWDMMSYWGCGLVPFWFSFDSDADSSRNSGDEQGEHAFHYTVPLLCINVTNDWEIREKSLLQYIRTFYPMLRFGLKPTLQWGFNYIHNGVADEQTLYYIPETAQSGEYIRLKCSNENSLSPTKYWYEIWNQDNTEAFNIIFEYYDEVEPSTWGLRSDRFTYPMSTYFSKSAAQATADTNRIYNMMIGTNTTTKAPFMFDLKQGGRTGAVMGDKTKVEPYSNGAAYYFVNWNNWNKGNVTATINLPSNMKTDIRDQNVQKQINLARPTGVSDTVSLGLPINTTFDIKRLKSLVATYKGQSLDICGGIPLMLDIERKGTVKVEIKCIKKYDDITKTSDLTEYAHIKFKKTSCTDNLNNYLTGTYGTITTGVKHDGSLTINIEDEKFELDVEKGDSVWMNIDPITLGQHIRITNLKVTYIDE